MNQLFISVNFGLLKVCVAFPNFLSVIDHKMHHLTKDSLTTKIVE
jgi:hypothetical protein